MEWVETTAKTVDEATEMALDQLGVAEDDAEVEVVEEPRPGLFGRMRGSARVKARVRPTTPRPKQERRRRGQKSSEARGEASNTDSGSSGDADEERASGGGGRSRRRRGGSGGGSSQGGSSQDSSSQSKGASRSAAAPSGDAGRGQRGGRNETAQDRQGGRKVAEDAAPREEREMMPEAEQRESGEEFLRGLLDAFGCDGAVSSSLDEEGVLAFEVEGENLGLLIGPGLATLDAVQEVCRNSIQRQAAGREYGKVALDVAGARAQRRVALEAFVRTEATRVLEEGDDVVFDVMSRSDRKIVHDVIGEFDGLATESVGEDPRRRVVLRRA